LTTWGAHEPDIIKPSLCFLLFASSFFEVADERPTILILLFVFEKVPFG
jgi:hypothetical protein